MKQLLISKCHYQINDYFINNYGWKNLFLSRRLRKLQASVQSFLPVLFVIDEFIKLGRTILWNAERLPFARPKMFGEQNYLPDMICVMRELAVDRLDDRMWFAADGDRLREIFKR